MEPLPQDAAALLGSTNSSRPQSSQVWLCQLGHVASSSKSNPESCQLHRPCLDVAVQHCLSGTDCLGAPTAAGHSQARYGSANFILLPVLTKLILSAANCTGPVWMLQCSRACVALLGSTNSSRPQSSQVWLCQLRPVAISDEADPECCQMHWPCLDVAVQQSLCSSAWEHQQQQATVKPGMALPTSSCCHC